MASKAKRAGSPPEVPMSPATANPGRHGGGGSSSDSVASGERDGGSAAPSSGPGPGPISYSELRRHLKEHLDAVCDSRAPLVVTRRNREPVVVLALSEYESLQETLHLLCDPANARHLLGSIAEAEADRFFEPSLDE